jgi:hypothetical protein
MQLFKKLVRKCLNLLQGMELIHAGHLFAINSVTGGPMASVPMSTNQEKEQSCLSKGTVIFNITIKQTGVPPPRNN